jgi:hypothetical protein
VYPPWVGGDIPTSCGNCFRMATTQKRKTKGSDVNVE